ncbi:MAG: hydantoinase/oxoprolinase family protein [Chloroflexota bacterium]
MPAPTPDSRAYRVGFDIGGTFTDFAMLDEATGALTFHKVLTTPSAPANAAIDGLREFLTATQVSAGALSHLVHGTTLVANALIERRGAAVGLITTGGFRDVLEIRTEQRYEIYDLFLKYPEPLVPRWLRLGVAERIDRDGRVLTPPDRAEIARAVAHFKQAGVQAVAICFLHAFRNPTNERQVRDWVQTEWPEVEISISSEIAPQIREYERTSTTVANAYVQPLLREYLRTVRTRLADLGFGGAFYPMLSSGGTASINTAERLPIQLIESGPAAGATAAAFFGRSNGRDELISFDMGGTTAKICLIQDGQPSISPNLEVARVDRFRKGSGIPLQLPTVEMIEIGAGGGSIAWIDTLGLLKVGPRSAGADPGPACYGRGGTAPTVTDANLILGYLNPGFFLGGAMSLDVAAAERAVATLAEPLGQSVVDTAWGIHALVNESMAGAARIHVIERAQDPRRYALLAFGGCGPVHAAGVASALNVSSVVCPPGAGVASAIGLLIAPPSVELARSYPVLVEGIHWHEVAELYRELEAQAIQQLAEVGVAADQVRFERAVDGRFAGQLHEIEIPLPPAILGPDPASGLSELLRRFNARYEELYKHLPAGMPIELLSWRLAARGPAPTINLPPGQAGGPGSLKGERPAYFGAERHFLSTPVHDRYLLQPGQTIAGPAIIEERESTIIVPPHLRVTVDGVMNVVLTTSPSNS